MNRQKSKLYRKVNTKAYKVLHNVGNDFKNSRNIKSETREQSMGSMFGKKHRGLDYTPLYRFLISKVGSHWDEVFSEAKSRLDKVDPIFHLVALNEEDKKDMVRCDESSYFSGLYVDEFGIIQLSNPNLEASNMEPLCNCCTFTFNGKIFGTQ